MSAGILAGRAARIEDPRALLGGKAGKIGFLERAGGDCRDLPPLRDALWPNASLLTKPTVDRNRLELDPEKFQGQIVEFVLRARAQRGGQRTSNQGEQPL